VGFSASRRFSGANGSLAWIVFSRERHIFKKSSRLYTCAPPGGIWFHGIVPSWSFRFFRRLERLVEPTIPLLASQTTS
jgi:hypothetical protein